MSSIIPATETILKSERFQALCRRCSISDIINNTNPIWDTLINQYSESHRKYHDKRHLTFCLQQFDLAASLIEDADAVETAIWFHDIINKPTANDNEEKSAELFTVLFRPYFEPTFVNNVCEIILATKHTDAPTGNDQAYMLDIDLSSLGIPWDYFFQDCNDLRLEFSCTSDDHYYTNKIRFFDVLLDRSSIYYSEFFSNRYEANARENLLRYNSLLKKQSI